MSCPLCFPCRGNIRDLLRNPMREVPRKPYNEGPWCSSCPDDMRSCFNGRLCAAMALTNATQLPPTTEAPTEMSLPTATPTEFDHTSQPVTTTEAVSTQIPISTTLTEPTVQTEDTVATTELLLPTFSPLPTVSPPPLEVHFINDSPRISGDTVVAEFTVTSETAKLLCDIQLGDTEKVDCE